MEINVVSFEEETVLADISEQEKDKYVSKMREGEDFLYVASDFLNFFVAHAAPAILFIILSVSTSSWLN